MIDGDPATDGLSLFLLGEKGVENVRTFSAPNTFVGILHEFQKTSSLSFVPHVIHRRAEGDHGVSYDAIISGKGLYGDEALLTNQLAVPDLDQSTFRAGVKSLFDALRASREYSYILIDTRGGFAFESTDVCALADSFIVVTEPDFTSFYQDRNLVARINRAAAEMQSPAVLRAMIVNKGTDVLHREDKPYVDNIEVSFRNELTKEFKFGFHDTHGVPVDIEALLAYKIQRIPYISAPGSLFSFATLSAFSDILQIVTSRWSIEQVDKWNDLVNKVTAAVKEKSIKEQQQEEERLKRERELEEMRATLRERDAKIANLDRELTQQNQLYEREFQRTQVLLERSLPVMPPIRFDQSKTTNKELPPTEAGVEVEGEKPVAPLSSPSRSRSIYIIIGILLGLLIVALGFIAYQSHKAAQNAREALNQQAREANATITSPSSQSNSRDSATQIGSGGYAVLISPNVSYQEGNPCRPNLAAEGAAKAAIAGYKKLAIYLKTATQIDLRSATQSLSTTPDVAVLVDSLDLANKELTALNGIFNNEHDQSWVCNAPVVWHVSVVSIDGWCPLKTAQTPIQLSQSVSVPVWKCGSALESSPFAPLAKASEAGRLSKSTTVPKK